MDSSGAALHASQRYFIGIGVAEYDDATLNLPQAASDVVRMANWFTTGSGIRHEWALVELGESPSSADIMLRLGDFLKECKPEDVVVIYMACHGELEGAQAYLFGRDTPRRLMATRSVNRLRKNCCCALSSLDG